MSDPLFTRLRQLVFGDTAGVNQISQFGSLAAGSPAYATTAATAQTANVELGWNFAAIGNSPAIEDMNAMFFIITSQLAYILQWGIPEWSSTTTYYAGQIVNSAGVPYIAIATSTGVAVTTIASWRPMSLATNYKAIDPATQSPYTLTAADMGRTFLVNTANGAQEFDLPNVPLQGLNFTVKDSGGKGSVNNITISRNGSGSLIENISHDFACAADYGVWTFASNAADYYLV